MIFDERDVLLKAASIVEEGWCQGKLHTYQGGEVLVVTASCAIGAIDRATTSLVNHGQRDLMAITMMTFGRYIDAQYGDVLIKDWNDAPGRTAHEVASAMREAANGNLG